jgi:hypothetical protein
MKQVDFSAAACANLADFLHQTSILIQENILALIPCHKSEGHTTNRFLYDLMRDYPSRGGKNFAQRWFFYLANGSEDRSPKPCLPH